MKKVLIVEDDSFKAKSLLEFLEQLGGFDVIKVATSLVEAIDAVAHEEYALILVDMAIPSHPMAPGAGSPLSFLTGGIEVLLELDALGRSDPCIVVTQYPDIEISGTFYSVKQATAAIKRELGCKVLSCIEYNEGDDAWKIALKGALQRNENSNN
jgi:CheY-like chemotaxis protein